eukprot:2010688-Pyramimonas_sp.AAC.1
MLTRGCACLVRSMAPPSVTSHCIPKSHARRKVILRGCPLWPSWTPSRPAWLKVPARIFLPSWV